MKVSSLEYRNALLGWSLGRTQFLPFTLLVGPTGAGKTRILKAIRSLALIARGRSVPGREWKVEFEDRQGRKCVWTGKFKVEKMQRDADYSLYAFPWEEEEDGQKAEIASESLTIGGRTVISRAGSRIKLAKKVMPVLSKTQSAIYSLREEKLVQPIHAELISIEWNEHSDPDARALAFGVYEPEKLLRRHKTSESLSGTGLSIWQRLFLVQKRNRSVFNKIRANFLSVFPDVSDVRVDRTPESKAGVASEDHAFVQIKDRDTSAWIMQWDISAGMLKSLAHIAEIALRSEGSVVLVDEVENSLGRNCIDTIVDQLMCAADKTQVIATSHHPYIINNVPASQWLVIVRGSGQVQGLRAKDLGIGSSAHDAFFQLLNSSAFAGK